MLTFDGFRDADGRRIPIVTGAVDAPVVYDRLRSVRDPDSCPDRSQPHCPDNYHCHPELANGWMGELPHPPTDAELRSRSTARASMPSAAGRTGGAPSIPGDNVRAFLTDDYQQIFLDVYEDGQLVAWPVLSLEQAQEPPSIF